MHQPLNLVRQPTPVTCVQACLAMCLGVPVESVIARYGERPLNTQRLLVALSECGVIWNQLTIGTLVHSGWYFAVVPSLNHRGGMHQIILHYDADRGCSGFTILDPAMGSTYATDGSDLLSWAELIAFHPGGRLPA